MQVRLQPLTRLNPQAQLPKPQQRQTKRPHDSTRPQLEKLTCSVIGAGDGDSAVLRDALADDNGDGPADLERVFPSIDCVSRPVDVCGAEGFLSCDAVHNTLHRLFIFAIRALHLYVPPETVTKAPASATLSARRASRSTQTSHRGNSQPAASRSRREPQLAHHP